MRNYFSMSGQWQGPRWYLHFMGAPSAQTHGHVRAAPHRAAPRRKEGQSGLPYTTRYHIFLRSITFCLFRQATIVCFIPRNDFY